MNRSTAFHRVPGTFASSQARNTSLGEAGIIRCSVITSVLGLAGDVIASSPVLPLSVLFLEVALEFVELRVPEPRIFVHPVRDFSQRLGAKRDQHFTAVPLALDEYTENSRLLVVSVL